MAPRRWATSPIRSASDDAPQSWTATASTGNAGRPLDRTRISRGYDARQPPGWPGQLARRAAQARQVSRQYRHQSGRGCDHRSRGVGGAVLHRPRGVHLSLRPYRMQQGRRIPRPSPLRATLPSRAGERVSARRTSYVDPNFGAKVRVMTGNPVFHTYSTPSPLSAHNKYLLTYPEKRHLGHPGRRYGHDSFFATRPLTRASSGTPWMTRSTTTSPAELPSSETRHPDQQVGPSSSTDASKQPEFQFHEIQRGGTGDTSKDNWISFWAPG